MATSVAAVDVRQVNAALYCAYLAAAANSSSGSVSGNVTSLCAAAAPSPPPSAASSPDYAFLLPVILCTVIGGLSIIAGLWLRMSRGNAVVAAVDDVNVDVPAKPIPELKSSRTETESESLTAAPSQIPWPPPAEAKYYVAGTTPAAPAQLDAPGTRLGPILPPL